MMKYLLVVLLVACGASKPASKPPADSGAPVGGIVPAKEIGLQISDAEGTRVMRLLPSGKIIVHDQIPTFAYVGFKIDAAGTLLREGQPVAKFGTDNTLETKLEQNVDKTVAVGDTTQRRALMFMWAGIVMSANNMRVPE
jgi:hypothetical protein